MIDEHERFKHRKNNWKRKTRRVLEIVSKMFEDIAYGRRPNMHDIWDYAHEMVSLGSTGVSLHEEATELRKSSRVFTDIAHNLHKIEVASNHLKAVSEGAGMPPDMPTFTSPIMHKAAEPRTTLEDVLATEDKE